MAGGEPGEDGKEDSISRTVLRSSTHPVLCRIPDPFFCGNTGHEAGTAECGNRFCAVPVLLERSCPGQPGANTRSRVSVWKCLWHSIFCRRRRSQPALHAASQTDREILAGRSQCNRRCRAPAGGRRIPTAPCSLRFRSRRRQSECPISAAQESPTVSPACTRQA